MREKDSPAEVKGASGVDLLSGSPVRGAGASSRGVARNLAKEDALETTEQKAFDLKMRDLELDFQSRMLQKEKEFADEKKNMTKKINTLKAELAKKTKEIATLTQDMVRMMISRYCAGLYGSDPS